MENGLLIKKQLLQQYVQTHNKTNSISIVNEQKDPFLIVDLQGDILYASRKSETVLGYTKPELMRMNAYTLLSFGSYFTKDRVTSRVIPFYKKNEPVSTELNVTIIPIYESEEQIGLYLVFHTKDFEEQKEGTLKAEEEWKSLVDKNTVAAQLVAEFSRDIQYNITIIKGFVELIKRGYGYKEYYKLVESELARLDLVLRELSMLMLSNNRDIGMYSMRELLSEVLTLLKHQAYLNNIEFEEEFIFTKSKIYGDKNQLKLIFISLLKNAIEAMPEGGKVLVEARNNGDDTILIRIKDEGLGIPLDLLGKIGHSRFTTKKGGTGLGLIVSRQIIDDHYGTITFVTDQKGTAVEINLPVCE
ncbi:hypothetical protein BC6307_22780 [Sutcliffiella cohnii]|uniref:histidine kinase n=1 Tax=Sutcliffiella cohnii TaxID=33932 RepID=A0A223KWQ2_9BACI|nr:ATP-binding protein [Sutcliffiella cohnii]AST93900.1 hypothetical protein BC6307_22780 [Sutcliffiella cohnii]